MARRLAGRCVYCGRPCKNLTCGYHSDLPSKDPNYREVTWRSEVPRTSQSSRRR